MNKGKKLGLIILLIVIAVVSAFTFYYFRTWPLRFHSELDDFFGKGNWEKISSETKESRMYTVYYSSRNDPSGSEERAGKFHNWDIEFTNGNGEKELWTITDHTMKINHDKHWILSPKRYSAKQALTLELMEISFSVAGEKVKQDILQKILPEAEADCLNVDISYRHGNPPPKMYDQLAKQPWFNANQITAADYLKTDLYDFYLSINAFDYRVGKLTHQEQQHLMESLDEIEEELKDVYGNDVDYEIYLSDEYRAKYPE